ncbi:MAG: penicillin-binding transpeptidase domain-containing protein, partial [Anaerolineae bacterium]
KAIGGLYAPGSTFKLVVAAGALQEQTVTPNQQFFDAGTLYLPNKFFPDDPELAQPFYCWFREGHGLVNLVSALALSCDVYFYQVGGGYEPSGYEGLGLERLVQYAEMFGFGAPTGIDIPGEGAGLVPTPRWKRLNYAETWVTGDTYNMSIGQGFVLATPLQVLNAFAAFANGGTLYKPFLVKEIRNPQKELVYRAQPQVLNTLNLSPDTFRWVEEGLQGVIEWGTAQDAINLPGITVSGKTGTAEFCDRYPQCLDREGRVKTSHAWFVAYAPSREPQVAVAAFIYGGGEGSAVAAPVVNTILRYYFQFDQPDDDTGAAPADSQPVAGESFTPRLLGSDIYPGPTAAVSGFIVNEQGQGIPGIALNIIANDEIVAQVFSGPTGQFDFNAIDPLRTDVWRVQLADYPDAAPIVLTVKAGVRYLVEFQTLTLDYES